MPNYFDFGYFDLSPTVTGTYTSLIAAFKASFDAQFSSGGSPAIPSGLITEELPRNAPMPNAALVEFTEDIPKSEEDLCYTLTLSVRAKSAATSWGLANAIMAYFWDNPDRDRLAWTGTQSEVESGQLALPVELHRERVPSSDGAWIWRADVQFEFFSLIQ